jgi:hypothetical protein
MDQTRTPAGSSRRSAAASRPEAERAEAAERVAVEAAEVAVGAAREADETLAAAERTKKAAAEQRVVTAEAKAAAAEQHVEMVLNYNQELIRQFSALIGQMRNGFVGPTATGPSPVGTTLTAEQERLALNYDALRTSLGRRGAASIVLYRIVRCDARADDENHRRHGDDGPLGVVIEHGHIDADSWIVIYGSQDERPGGSYGEIGREPYLNERGHSQDGVTCFPELPADQHIDRLEVQDRHGRPVRLGRPLPHHVHLYNEL